jgi:hypothetical protein
MPDRDVRTLRDLIWYPYAKIVARRALGPDVKPDHYGFVKQTLRDIQSGRKQWSDIAREDWRRRSISRRSMNAWEKALPYSALNPKAGSNRMF